MEEKERKETGKYGKADDAPGQQEIITLTNATGGTLDVTKADWRKRGKELRAEGWKGPVDETEEVEEGPTTPGIE